MKKDFITPPNHVNFLAKKLFGEIGEIIDGSIAYLQPNGGGPDELHTHDHNHLFIVTKGEAKILLGDKEIIVKKDESFLVKGSIPHSVWNNTDAETVMIGISVK
ncbi:MAG: cupin domain-containing protein [Oscillospiraceae bacterium]|nr:cupin domain-containing protein [Oscillospiraceae bacterium]